MIRRSRAMQASLNSKDGEKVFPLQDFSLVGRGSHTTVRVRDASVSREHASLHRDGGIYWLSDLKSANGTFINEVRVTGKRALIPGDTVRFGTVSLTYECVVQEEVEPEAKENPTTSLPVKTIRMTMLVGDLRNFTGISAQLPATEVADLLAEWYRECRHVLKSRGAIIDKFIGDGVVALWPGDDGPTRLAATEAARLLCGTHAHEHPTRWRLRQSRGIEVRCHAGLHVGDVAFGTLRPGETSAVGRPLRVAASVEGLTRKLDVPVLASAQFVEDWPEGRELFRSEGSFELAGRAPEVAVYSLNGVA